MRGSARRRRTRRAGARRGPGGGSTPRGPQGTADRWSVVQSRLCVRGGRTLTATGTRGVLQIMTDTDVRLWRRVHMDLVRYAGCVCRSSC
ncbi:putative leader peptide [Streptomyces globisporus]